jgi:hypothetical protein
MDFRVVHLDPVDDRAQPGAAQGGVAGQHFGAHGDGEGRDLVFVIRALQAHFGNGAVEGALRDVALALGRRGAVLQRPIVCAGDAVVDGLMQATEPSPGIGELAPIVEPRSGSAGEGMALQLHDIYVKPDNG